MKRISGILLKNSTSNIRKYSNRFGLNNINNNINNTHYKFNTFYSTTHFNFMQQQNNFDNNTDKDKDKEIDIKKIFKFNNSNQDTNTKDFKFNNTKENKKNTDNTDKNQETEENSESTNTNKTPSTSLPQKAINSLKSLWHKTFPGEQDYTYKLEQRMQEAKELKAKIHFASETELYEIEAEVPDWKVCALVLVDEESIFNQGQDSDDYLNSYFNYTKVFVQKQVYNSEMYHKMQKTSTYKEYKQFQEDFQVVKNNINDNISTSYNPIVVVTKDLIVSLYSH